MQPDRPPWRLLVFGATGAIGGALCATAEARGWSVTRVTRGRPPSAEAGWVQYDPFTQDGSARLGRTPYDAVCWAQGANFADNVRDLDATAHLDLYKANCLHVLLGLRELLSTGLLAVSGARLCVVSSIWQNAARQNKLSYTMTKAAIGGLVRAASVDLAADGHLINAVLPGVTDSPMTHANVSSEQLARVQGATPGGRLASLESVAALIAFVCSTDNAAMTGESLTIDQGFSHARLL